MVKSGIALLIRDCFSARIADRFPLSPAQANCSVKTAEVYGPLTERLKSGSLAASSYAFL